MSLLQATNKELSQNQELAEFFNDAKQLVIPNKYLAHHLQKVVDRWETGVIPSQVHTSKRGNKFDLQPQKEYDRVWTIAQAVGISHHTMHQILSGEGSSLFRTVDKIFSALDLTHLWYEDENLALAYTLVR